MKSKSVPAIEISDKPEGDTITRVLENLRQGDAEAAEILFQRYARRLARIAQKYLSLALARRFDAEDVTQSVFQTFFRRLGDGEYNIANAEDLWRLLVKITILKTRAKCRQHCAAMRDVRAEVESADEETWQSALAADPKILDALALTHTIETALQDFPDFYRAILELRLRSFAVAEIAILLQKSRRSIYRALDHLKICLAQTMDGD